MNEIVYFKNLVTPLNYFQSYKIGSLLILFKETSDYEHWEIKYFKLKTKERKKNILTFF